jgi:flagellar basal body-associated protein FliL
MPENKRKGSNQMKKLLIVCIIALVAVFSITGCATSASNESSHIESTTQDCCKGKEATASEVPECCKNKDTDNSSSKASDVPDCCSGE